MKKIIIEEKRRKALVEAVAEVTYFSFFTQIKNFIRKLLQDPVHAEASDELKDYLKCDNKHIIEKLIRADIIRRENNIVETPKEVTADGKSQVRYSVKYSVPKKNFKDKIHALFSKEVLNENVEQEYLDKYWGKPLHDYFTQSEESEAQNYLYNGENFALFFEFLQDYGYIDALSDEDQNDIYQRCQDKDETLVNDIVEGKYSQYCEKFLEYLDQNTDYIDQPSTRTMSFTSDVNNQWLVHFSDNADEIWRDGFEYGTADYDNLNYSDCGNIYNKENEGIAFAFEADDVNKSSDSTRYGQEAVMFQASGVKAYHYGDCEDQVMFWTHDAKNLVWLRKDNGEWYVGFDPYHPLYHNEEVTEVIDWVERNFNQYRKKLLNPRESQIHRRQNNTSVYNRLR